MGTKITAALEWIPIWDGREGANTPFGSYWVERKAGGIQWGYCFTEYYDEDNSACDSIDAGKAAAQADWDDRISDLLTEACAPIVGELVAGLRETVEWGLIYWEPQTERGHIAKADMTARMQSLLAKHGGAA